MTTESKLKIITNHKYRELLHGFQLTKKECAELDYIEDISECFSRFFRYRGQIYDIQEFTRIVPPGAKSVGFEHHDHTGELAGWHGIQTDSFFSGIVIAYQRDDFEYVKVGLVLY